MSTVKRHYSRVRKEVAIDCPMRIDSLTQPLVIVLLDRWIRITEKGLRFALKISEQVQAVHVDAEECCDEVKQMWQQNVAAPLHDSGKIDPELILLALPYRFVITPLVDYILKLERDKSCSPDCRPGPRIRRQTPVADPAAQPARPTAEAPPSCPRQSAHHGHQHSLVPLTHTAPFSFNKPKGSRCGQSSRSNYLKPHRIANADQVTRHSGRKTEAAMKIELLMRRGFVGDAEIDQVLWTAAFRKSTGVFDIRIDGLCNLPVEVYAGLPRHISPP